MPAGLTTAQLPGRLQHLIAEPVAAPVTAAAGSAGGSLETPTALVLFGFRSLGNKLLDVGIGICKGYHGIPVNG
jgi:hypothetical protein